MRKVLSSVLSSIVVVLVSMVAVAACVGDEPAASPAGTAAQGALGGACFANGTCNSGLTCSVVEGKAQCATSSGNPGVDASTVDASSDSSAVDAADAGPLACKFQTTPFPCGDPQPPAACYGATQSCTLTGCGGGGDLRWECNSPNQCGTACCVPVALATLTAGMGCTEGSLLITAGATSGAVCGAAIACPADNTQLCQSNSQCPVGQRCAPVKIIGAGAAFNGTILGACVP